METARIVMASNKGVCVALPDQSDLYIVVTVASGPVEIDDKLQGTFTNPGLTEVFNLQKFAPVTVSVIELGCSRVRALDAVRNLNCPDRVVYAEGHP